MSAKSSRARVLVVDDSPTVVHLLQALLEAAAFDVATARDGHEGLARAREQTPDAIVTDSLMPGMDGYAFLRALRTEPHLRRIPVIMLTSADPTDTSTRPDEERPDAVVTKSSALDQVVAEVERALGRTPRGQA